MSEPTSTCPPCVNHGACNAAGRCIREPEAKELESFQKVCGKPTAEEASRELAKVASRVSDLQLENAKLEGLLRRSLEAMEREECFGDLFLEPIRKALQP